MVILITLLAIVLAQPRDSPHNNSTHNKPTHSESISIQELLKTFEGFTQNQSQELKEKSKAVTQTVLSQGYQHYQTLDENSQKKIRKSVKNISNTLNAMNQEEKNRLQNDYTKFLELNTTEEEAVLTLISQNLTQFLNSTNEFSTPVIISNMENILEEYIINHPKVNSTWHIITIEEIEQEKKIQHLFKQGKSIEQIRTIINKDIQSQDQKLQQLLLEELDLSLKFLDNNSNQKNNTHQPNFFAQEVVITTILNSFIISEQEELKINSNKNVHYIFGEFKNYYELSNEDQQNKIDSIIQESPRIWDEMNQSERNQIKEQYIYFIKLPQNQQEIILTLISANLTQYMQNTQEPTAQQIIQIISNIVNSYKLNPQTDAKSTWNLPTENGTTFDIEKRYEELQAEGKTNDEIRSILLTELYQNVQNEDQQNVMIKLIEEKIQLEKEKLDTNDKEQLEAKTEEQLQKERDTFALIIFIFIGVAILATIVYVVRRQYLKMKKIKGNNSNYSMPEFVPEQID